MKFNVGLLNLLTIVFVVLKLVGVITWSWWLVLLPTIIWLNILVLFILFISFMLSLVNRLVEKSRGIDCDNKDNDAEDLFKEIEKKLRRKGK